MTIKRRYAQAFDGDRSYLVPLRAARAARVNLAEEDYPPNEIVEVIEAQAVQSGEVTTININADQAEQYAAVFAEAVGTEAFSGSPEDPEPEGEA